MNSFICVEESRDERLLKNRTHPQWVHILNKEYCKYMNKHNDFFSLDCIKRLSSIQRELFSDFDYEFKGKMDYKGAQDYMGVWPLFKGCFGVINEKIKTIFDELNISKEEYILHPIDIEGVKDNYYLMFIFQVPMSNIILPSSVYCNGLHPDIVYKLKTLDQFYDGGFECIYPMHIALDKYFSNVDILRIETCADTFFSDRLVDKLKQNNVVGLDYRTSGIYRGNVITSLSFE